MSDRGYPSEPSARTLLIQIFSVALPVMLTELVQALYNIADSAYVARFDPAGMTAVSIASPLHKLIYALSLLCGVGSSILLSRSMGEKNESVSRRVIFNGTICGIFCWLVLFLAAFFLTEPYFRLFSSNEHVIQTGVSYIRIIMIGSIFPVLENVSVRCLQALGIAKKPMLYQTGAAFMNIVLDPLFIWGWRAFPSFGVRGAAMATVLSQAVSSSLSFATLRQESTRIWGRTEREIRPALLGQIGKAGFPAFLEIALVSGYISGLNGIMSGFSEAAVTSLGIYYKLQTILLIPTDGVMLGAIPLMSYYFGAGDRETVWKTFRIGWLVSLAANLLGMTGCMCFTRQLMLLFNASGELMQTGITALRIISLAFPFFGFTMLPASFFQSVGRGRYSVILTLLREVLFLVPIAWLLSRWGLTASWYTFVISEVLAAVAAMKMAFSVKKAWRAEGENQ